MGATWRIRLNDPCLAAVRDVTTISVATLFYFGLLCCFLVAVICFLNIILVYSTALFVIGVWYIAFLLFYHVKNRKNDAFVSFIVSMKFANLNENLG